MLSVYYNVAILLVEVLSFYPGECFGLIICGLLREMFTLVHFTPYFLRESTIVTFYLLSNKPSSLEKGSTLKESSAPTAEKGRQNYF